VSAFPPANAAAAFDHLAQAADEGLNPGIVKLGSVEYTCGVSRSDLRWVSRPDGGGFVRVQNCYASIHKSALPQRPATGTGLHHDAAEFKIISVDGDNTTDAAWFITAQREIA